MAMVPRRRDEDHAPGIRRPRAIHLGCGQPRRPARRRDRRESCRQLVEGAIARRGGRRERRAAIPASCADRVGRWARVSGGTSLFYLSAAEQATVVEAPGRTSVRSPAETPGGALTEPAAISRDGSRVAVVVREDGSAICPIMSADGTNARTLAASINITGAPGQGAADWSPDGAWIAASGTDASGLGLFKIPVQGGTPVRLVSGQAYNPVWSPDGQLIVYGDGLGAEVTLRGVRPDGTPVNLPPLSVRPGACRFLPDGTGLVCIPSQASQNFALLDLKTKKSRPLTSPRRPRSVDDLRHHARRAVHRLRSFARELEHRAVRAAGEVTPGKGVSIGRSSASRRTSRGADPRRAIPARTWIRTGCRSPDSPQPSR